MIAYNIHKQWVKTNLPTNKSYKIPLQIYIRYLFMETTKILDACILKLKQRKKILPFFFIMF